MRDRRRRPARHGAWPLRCAPRASTSTARSAAAPTRAAPTPCCCACPTPRSPPPPRRSRPGRSSGHCSGATGLDVLARHEAFAPAPADDGARGRVAPPFAGAGCAVAGTTPRALAIARALAARLGMRATTVADDDRAAYHAAASIASNFLVTLEGAAERLAATAGVERELLAPLVRAAVDNWARLGAARRADRPDRPRRRGDRRAPARRGRGARARPRSRSSTRSPTRRARWRRWRVRTRAHDRRACASTSPPPARAGRSVGLVPTMGAFHAGHEALMRAARERCDEVVVSLFVNPTQFDESGRPRGLPAHGGERRRDRRGARRRRAVRARGSRRSTPTASRRRSASTGSPTVLEGAARGAGHFAGVCTVVAKLLHHRRARRRLLRRRRTPSRSP